MRFKADKNVKYYTLFQWAFPDLHRNYVLCFELSGVTTSEVFMQAFLQRPAPYTLFVRGELADVRKSGSFKESRDVVK